MREKALYGLEKSFYGEDKGYEQGSESEVQFERGEQWCGKRGDGW